MNRNTDQPIACKYSQRKTLILTALVMLIAFGWSIYLAQREQTKRTLPLDLDGWGHRVSELKVDHSFLILFDKPSVWKGPIVPFLFGMVYYFFPSEYSVLYFNSLCFSLTAGLMVYFGCRSGLPWVCPVLAALAWIVYPPFEYIHGYYYAESPISLLVILTVGCYWLAMDKPSSFLDLLIGVLSGMLLMARPPFLIPILGMVLLFAINTNTRRFVKLLTVLVGITVVIAPWILRNYFELNSFVPFTLEGGKILFQGTYLPGDDLTMNELRQDPNFSNLETNVETTMTPVEQYHYWQKEAKQNILDQPLAEGIMMLRKTIRFWAYLPKGSWMPSLLTGLCSSVLLILGCIGTYVYRHNRLVMLFAFNILGLWMFHAIVHAEMRYNFPVINLLMILAMLGLYSVAISILKLRRCNRTQHT